MTNTELLAKIKAEIERRYYLYGGGRIPEEDYPVDAVMQELEELLSFLDTLEKSNSKDFPTTDEEIKHFLATHPKVELPEKYKTPDWIFENSEKPMQEGLENEAVSYCFDNGLNLSPRVATDFARHFAEWGAERQKEQDLAEMAQSKSPLSVAYANRCFENGKQAMKEQMLKEAVEGTVATRGDLHTMRSLKDSQRE